MTLTEHSGYDLTRLIESVEGVSSKTALTLSGPMEIHDILNAFNKAYQGIQQREQKEIEEEQNLRQRELC